MDATPNIFIARAAWEKAEAKAAAAKAKLDAQDYEDCFEAERKYGQLHAKAAKAKQAYLSAGGRVR